jgi:hypothetical protein
MAMLNQLQASVLSNVFLFVLIMGMAGTTDMTGFRAKLRNYRGIGCGLGTQFLLLPFLGFCSVKAFNLPRLYGIMLLIVTSSPGGGFSGWWCSLCNADIALSIAMTTVSTLFSIALLPLNIFIYVQALYGLAVPINVRTRRSRAHRFPAPAAPAAQRARALTRARTRALVSPVSRARLASPVGGYHDLGGRGDRCGLHRAHAWHQVAAAQALV